MDEYGHLQVEARTATGKGAARSLRRDGRLPAVVYGRGQDNLSITIDPRQFRKATDPSRSWNTFYQLAVIENGKQVALETCVVADVQMNTLRHEVLHVDFMRVDPAQEVVRKVPVRVFGRAAGVVKGGRLRTFRRWVRVAAKPSQIPVEIAVDITALDGGQYIRMADIGLDNARIQEPERAPLAFCEMPKAKTEEAEAGKPEGKKK